MIVAQGHNSLETVTVNDSSTGMNMIVSLETVTVNIINSYFTL